MATTTTYGSWVNITSDSLTVEETIANYVSGADSDWRERFESTGAAERVATDYRQAIQDALPAGIFLAGNEFIGPYYEADQEFDAADYPRNDEDEIDLTAIVESVDLAPIVERHDPEDGTGDGMNGIATTRGIEGGVIEDGVSIERKLWIIGQGEYDDVKVIGVYAGTETEGSALVAELNASRRHEDPCDGTITLKGDEYWLEETRLIASAADIIGHHDPDSTPSA